MKNTFFITYRMIFALLCTFYVNFLLCGDRWNRDLSDIIPLKQNNEIFKISDIQGRDTTLRIIGAVFKLQREKQDSGEIESRDIIPVKMRILEIVNNNIKKENNYDIFDFTAKYYMEHNKHIGLYYPFYFNDTFPITLISAQNRSNKELEFFTVHYPSLIETRWNPSWLKFEYTTQKNKLSSVVGNYDKSYWKCNEKICSFFLNDTEAAFWDDGEFIQPNIVGFDQKLYWLFYNNTIRKVGPDRHGLKLLFSCKSANPESLNILTDHVLKKCIPYSTTQALLIGIKKEAAKPTSTAAQKQMFYAELDEHNEKYTIVPLETLMGTENIAITKNPQSNTHTLHVLLENQIHPLHSCSLEKLISDGKAKRIKQQDIVHEAQKQAATLAAHRILQSPLTTVAPSSSTSTPLAITTASTHINTPTTTGTIQLLTTTTSHTVPPEKDKIINPQLQSTQSSLFYPKDFSQEYTVELNHKLNGTPAAFLLSNKNYTLGIDKDSSLAVYEKDNEGKQWFQASTYIHGEATMLGIVPGKHGDRLVLQNNLCIWADPKSIAFGSRIEVPTTMQDCKKYSTVEEKPFFIDESGIVYIEKKQGSGHISRKPLVYNSREIKAYTLISTAKEKGLVGIITHPDRGYPEFLIVKKKDSYEDKIRKLKAGLAEQYSHKPSFPISTKNQPSASEPVIKSLPFRILDTIQDAVKSALDSFKKFWVLLST